jgi:hypothetical protein
MFENAGLPQRSRDAHSEDDIANQEQVNESHRGFPLLMGRKSASIAAFASVQFEVRGSLCVAIITPCVSLRLASSTI